MMDIREALNSAMEQVGSEDAVEAPEATVESSLPEEPSFDAPEVAEAAPPAASPQAKVTPKSLAKPGTQQAAVKAGPQAVAPTTPASAPPAVGTPEARPAAPSVKAPQSWRPELREKFAGLPPEVQQEVVRREREVATAMQQAAEARKTAETYSRVVEPYRALMTDAPERVVGGLLQTAAVLRTGTPQMKAQMVAHVIRENAVPVDLLDAVLSGQAPQQGQQPQSQHMDPDAIRQQVEQSVYQRLQQQAQQSVMAKAQQEADEFINSGKAEFLEDVRPVMANLLRAAGQSGIQMSLEDAYNQACAIVPDVSRVLKQREMAQQANVTQASTQRARNAAASVRSSPAAPPSGQKPKDLGGTLRDAWDAHSGR